MDVQIETIEYVADVEHFDQRIVLGHLVSNGPTTRVVESDLPASVRGNLRSLRHVQLILAAIKAKAERSETITAPSAQVFLRRAADSERERITQIVQSTT